MDQFKASSGPAQLSWEHAAWQVQNVPVKGDLVLTHNLTGWSSSSLWPALLRGGSRWSKRSADAASWSLLSTWRRVCHQQVHFDLDRMNNAKDNIRRKLADSLCSAPDPLAVTPQPIEFYGQRPWRPGKQEPPDLAKEKEGIEALQYREKTWTNHSQIILDLPCLATE